MQQKYENMKFWMFINFMILHISLYWSIGNVNFMFSPYFEIFRIYNPYGSTSNAEWPKMKDYISQTSNNQRKIQYNINERGKSTNYQR